MDSRKKQIVCNRVIEFVRKLYNDILIIGECLFGLVKFFGINLCFWGIGALLLSIGRCHFLIFFV